MTARIVAMLYCIIFLGLLSGYRFKLSGARFSDTSISNSDKHLAVHSSPAANSVALSTQIVGQVLFHLNSVFVRHRVEMLEQLRQQSDTVFPNQPRRFVTVLMIFESMIYR